MIATLGRRYLPALDETLHTLVDAMPAAPDFDLMARYALGWVNVDGSPHNQPTGKRIRPLLLLLCAEAVGAAWQAALPAAAAVELLHNFSLIHDDIQDDSDTRHGRPTVWKVWGMANAINAGDALFALAYHALERLTAAAPHPTRARVAVQVWQVFNHTNLELTRGQHLDMRFEKQAAVSTDEYLSMIQGKSAALVAASAQMGALIGSGKAKTAQHFYEYGLNLGIAFQIHDDILGIWGDPAVTGKSAATDILARKKSLPVLHGLATNHRLKQLYARKTFGEAQVAETISLLDECGAKAYTYEAERVYYDRAWAALDRASVTGEAAQGLRDLTEFLFDRKY